MKIFYYVHTGHRIGLDRFRRAVAILNMLNNDEITLLCSDFRIAQEARLFGIKNSVGIDIIRNIPSLANHGDKLIFDSDEANPIMLDDMRKYFSSFIRISDNKEIPKADNEYLISNCFNGDGVCNAYAISNDFFGNFKKSISMTYFFGDDDYEKDLEKHFDFIDDLDLYLQLGYYYFFDYEDMLKEKFKKYFEFEEYEDMIKQTDILITASPQAVLDSLASGGRPIFIKREDYSDDFDDLINSLNIPIINNYNKKELKRIISSINDIKYKKVENYSNKIVDFIKNNLN